jgi:hypothetical protein
MSVVKRNKHTIKDTIKVSRSVKFLLYMRMNYVSLKVKTTQISVVEEIGRCSGGLCWSKQHDH